MIYETYSKRRKKIINQEKKAEDIVPEAINLVETPSECPSALVPLFDSVYHAQVEKNLFVR